MAKSFHPIFDIIDGASADFDKVVEASEKKILQETLSLIKGLETDAQGNIKTTISNLKKIGVIKTRLTKIANNKQFLAGVAKLIGAFDKIYNEQKKYFDSLSSNFVAHTNYHMGASSKFELMKSIAAQNVANNLTGAGLSANVTGKISDMLLRAVTTGAKYSDIVSEMHAYLLSTETSQGALSKYAKTYAVTALGQYTGQNNKLVTDDLGCEWFMYTGSTIETTREFCAHMTKKKYIHISEFADILAGKIDGHECAIYDKTGLPYGLIEGTTPENFLVNVGGWNCRHQLVPIAKEMVPAEIRAKFEKPKQPTKEEIEAQKKAEEETKLKALQEQQKQQAIKDAQDIIKKMGAIPAADSLKQAIKTGDAKTIQAETIKLYQLEKQLQDLVHIADVMEEAKTHTYEELKMVNDAVEKTINTWLKKYSYKKLEDNPQHATAKLEQEIMSLLMNKKYATWEIAQKAYQKKLANIKDITAYNSLVDDLHSLQGFKTTSKSYKALLSELEDAITSKDLIKANNIKAQLLDKQKKLSQNAGNTEIKAVTKHNPKSTNNNPQTEHDLTKSLLRGSDGIDAIEEATGVSREIAKDYLEAVIGFSWEWDYEIRQVQCGNNVKSKYGHTLDKIIKKAIDLEEFIAKSPRWVGRETYRGIALSPKEIAYARTELKNGDYDMLGSASWSTVEHTARTFAERNIGKTSAAFGDKKTQRVVFVAKGHTKATSIRHLSEFPGENEVLASKRCRYKIVSERTEGNYLIFEVEPSI